MLSKGKAKDREEDSAGARGFGREEAKDGITCKLHVSLGVLCARPLLCRLNARLFGMLSTLSILVNCFARLLTRDGRAAECDSPIDHKGCTLFQRFESPFGNKLLGQCAGFASYESTLSILSRPENERAIAKRQIESLGTKAETIVPEKSNKIIIDSAATFRTAWNHSATRAQMQHWPCNPLQ
jgi:hypothetical protein